MKTETFENALVNKKENAKMLLSKQVVTFQPNMSPEMQQVLNDLKNTELSSNFDELTKTSQDTSNNIESKDTSNNIASKERKRRSSTKTDENFAVKNTINDLKTQYLAEHALNNVTQVTHNLIERKLLLDTNMLQLPNEGTSIPQADSTKLIPKQICKKRAVTIT